MENEPTASLTWSSQNNCRSETEPPPLSQLKDLRDLSYSDLKSLHKNSDALPREYLIENSDPTHAFITVVCTHCGSFARVPVYCGNRFCNTCHSQRQKRVKSRINWLIRNRPVVKGTMLKLLTLTLKSDENLERMVKHLVKSFRKLRQRKQFKKWVVGGAFVIEVVNKSGLWHAHIHAVVQAYLINWSILRDMWKECSGGSTGVDIRNKPAHVCLAYITKYISKSELSTDLQFIASNALRSYRLFNPFGEWYAVNLAYVPSPSICPTCQAPASFLPWEVFQGFWKG